MNIEELREYCLGKKGVTEGFPFNESTLVFKVMDKMFALADVDSDPLRINLKCEPTLAIELREKYVQVLPGYHMNKKHWNTVVADALLTNRLLMQWLDQSYQLVVGGLTKKDADKLNAL